VISLGLFHVKHRVAACGDSQCVAGAGASCGGHSSIDALAAVLSERLKERSGGENGESESVAPVLA
jgi:hypothetical protein